MEPSPNACPHLSVACALPASSPCNTLTSLSSPPPTVTMAHQNISKKRKFVADGVFYSELNEVRIRPRTAKRGARLFCCPDTHSGLYYTGRTDTERGARGILLATGSGKGSCAVVAPTRRSRACVASRRPSVCEVEEGCCRSFGDWRLQGGWPIKTIRNERGVLETASHLGTGIASLPGSIGTRGARTSAAASLEHGPRHE